MLTLRQFHTAELTALRSRHPEADREEVAYFTREYVRRDWIDYLIRAASAGESIPMRIWNSLTSMDQNKIKRNAGVLRARRNS